VVYIETGILFSQRKNDILSSAGKWMELEANIVGEISQMQKVKS
jgi:hypothetical protein